LKTLAAKEGLSFSRSDRKWSDIATISIIFDNEDVAIVAYSKEDDTPFVMVTKETFANSTNENQSMIFKKIGFREFEGYEIWSCEIVGEEMRVCLVK
jgi:hypothetical protein